MHSVIAVDENGNALADMITWADSRSEDDSTATVKGLCLRVPGSIKDIRYPHPCHDTALQADVAKAKPAGVIQSRHTNSYPSKEYLWFKLFKCF